MTRITGFTSVSWTFNFLTSILAGVTDSSRPWRRVNMSADAANVIWLQYAIFNKYSCDQLLDRPPPNISIFRSGWCTVNPMSRAVKVYNKITLKIDILVYFSFEVTQILVVLSYSVVWWKRKKQTVKLFLYLISCNCLRMTSDSFFFISSEEITGIFLNRQWIIW